MEPVSKLVQVVKVNPMQCLDCRFMMYVHVLRSSKEAAAWSPKDVCHHRIYCKFKLTERERDKQVKTALLIKHLSADPSTAGWKHDFVPTLKTNQKFDAMYHAQTSFDL
eukprot:1640521-Amphidinium_carterae.2